jgi:large conductance mechanosensitive channel
MDMAVGVIIGGAFGAIVSSLVDNILGPIIGMILGGVDFSSLSVKLGEATLQYGAFIQAIIDFLIVALVIFSIVKAVNKVKDAAAKKEEEKPEEPAGPSTEELLGDILAELKKK